MFTRTPVLTRLHKLDISHSSGVTGVLSILLCHSFPVLETLILSDCWLNSDDLRSLAQANKKGRLPKLKHLDISQNPNIKTGRETFFCYDAKWEELNCLIIDRAEGGISNIFSQENDCLVNLKEVIFHAPGKGILDENCSKCWVSLTKVEITCVIEDFTRTMIGFVYNIERGNLPSLETIKIKVLMYVMNSSEFLPNLWETLNKKLQPSVCKTVMVSLMNLERYLSDDSIFELSNDIHLSDEKIVGKIVDDLVKSIILKEPMTCEEKDFLHNTLTDCMCHVIGLLDVSNMRAPCFPVVSNILTLKQRLYIHNVCVFTFWEFVIKRLQLNQKYYWQ